MATIIFPPSSFADHVTLLYGKARLIVRTMEGNPGMFRVKAISEPLQSNGVELTAQ